MLGSRSSKRSDLSSVPRRSRLSPGVRPSREVDVTETEWLSCTDSSVLLKHLTSRRVGKLRRSPAGLRKMRLFACACCRRIWHLLDEPCRHAVEVSERYADGA